MSANYFIDFALETTATFVVVHLRLVQIIGFFIFAADSAP